MKMIKKITAVTAALAAAASMSAVAFAENDFTATYNKGADTVSVDLESLTATFSDQITVVIVEAGTESISSENIYYIDQDSVANKSTLLTNMGVLAGSIVAGKTYEVRIGCTEGDIYKGTFKLDPDVLYGDVDGNGNVTGTDAYMVLLKSADSGYVLTVEAAADVDGNGNVTGTDAYMVLLKSADPGYVFPVESTNAN